jgi:putative membrane-bound dehydrogenase-like protein
VSAPSAVTPSADHPRFTPEISEFVRNFKPGGQDYNGQAKVLPPEESLRRMVLPEGYVAELVASEPQVRQPIDIRFDERGRLWVVQYLQYPFPAGLTVTAYDQYIRAEFDRVPLPPPRHVRGADKITILEDQDGDGKFETHKTFVDGLSLATSVLPGDGGVWVMMSPYLLFYPDRNGDDIPDGDPEVHLSGFGIEDTHSLASSLHWGPDGWIYGATGSTTTLEVQGIRLLGQGIWRYHPGTRVFEVFAEGGGNTFSLEFDQYGRAFSGTNNGATRGLHYAQGATYVKGWSKHGPALNPFLFGFFPHMAHEGYSPRFAQTIILYEADALPQLRGQIVAGMSLTNRVQASAVLPDTSTFRTVDRTVLIATDDKAFRPVDIEQGPDGAIYLADWTDLRLSHLNPADTWDKSNGRIFRIVPKDFVRPPVRDLRRASTPELITVLADPNREKREQARRLLAQRPETIAATLQQLIDANASSALEALWVLNLRHEIAEAGLRRVLAHPNEHLRRWAVRLLGDPGLVQPATATALARLAQTEPAVEVRSQLASTARRLPAGQAFPILRALLLRDEDAADHHLPLLIWWAIESKADTGREEILTLVSDPALWRAKIFSTHTAERIAMRYTADQGPRRHYTLKQGVYSEWIIDRAPEHLRRNLEMGARLLEAAPESARATLLRGLAQGLTGPRVESVPGSLEQFIARAWRTSPHSTDLLVLAARLGVPEATGEALARIKDPKLKDADRQTLIDLLAALPAPEALPVIAGLLQTEKSEARRASRLAALGGFNAVAAAEAVIAAYPSLSPRLQNTAQRMLSERPIWAMTMLQRMNLGTFKPGVLSSSNIALIRSHKDPRLTSLYTTYQQSHSDDPAQQAAQRLFETGRIAFNLTCAPCHQESGSGLPMLAPALVGSRWLQASEEHLVRIVLHGKENPGRGLIMPPWRQLEDGQIAAILTYVRREFGNQPAIVSAAQVAAVRAATAERQKAWTDPELDALRPSPTRSVR